MKYAPKVTVTVVGGTTADGRITEGSDVIYKCHADANPSEVTHRWYINEELVVGDYKTQMVSDGISFIRANGTQERTEREMKNQRNEYSSLLGDALDYALISIIFLFSFRSFTIFRGSIMTASSSARCTMSLERARPVNPSTSAVSGRSHIFLLFFVFMPCHLNTNSHASSPSQVIHNTFHAIPQMVPCSGRDQNPSRQTSALLSR